MRMPAVKRKPLKACNFNQSKTLNRSISTYGKVQIRFLNDIPCSNWLPSDESIIDDKKKDIFADATDDFKKSPQTIKSAQHNNLFDSDSDDDFKVTLSHKIKKSKARKKPELSLKKAASAKRKPKQKRKKIAKDANFVEKIIVQTSPPPDSDNNVQSLEKEDLLMPDDVNGENSIKIQNLVSKEAPTVEKESNKSFVAHEHSEDMFANYDIGTSQANIELPAKLSNDISVVPKPDMHKRKSILKHSLSAKNLNSTGQSRKDLSITSIRRVSFDSTVVYHAANIEMDERIPSNFGLSSLHRTPAQQLRLGDKPSTVIQSTPLANQQVISSQFIPNNKNYTGAFKELKSAHMNLEMQQCSSQAHDKAQKNSPIQQNEANVPNCNQLSKCDNTKKSELTAVKRKTRKAPVKRKPKKAPVWKKNGGNSFCKKSKIKNSDNDSILHQIMIGGTVDPKFNFFDDSDDVYFVDSKGEDSLQVKLTVPASQEQNIVTQKSRKAKKRNSSSSTIESEIELPNKRRKSNKKQVASKQVIFPEKANMLSSSPDCDKAQTKSKAASKKQISKEQAKKINKKPRKILPTSSSSDLDKAAPHLEVTSIKKVSKVQARTINNRPIQKPAQKSIIQNPASENVSTDSSAQENNILAPKTKMNLRAKKVKNYKDISNGTFHGTNSSIRIVSSVESSALQNPNNFNSKSKIGLKEESNKNVAFEHSTFLTQHLKHIAGRTRRTVCRKGFMSDDSSSLFSTLSFTSVKHNLTQEVNATKPNANVKLQDTRVCTGSPRRSKRATKHINYKDFSRGDISKLTAIRLTNETKEPNKKGFRGSSNDDEANGKTKGNKKSESSSSSNDVINVSNEACPKPNNFICNRNRRIARKTAPVISSDNSSLFSSLSFSSQKKSNSVTASQSNSMTVPMHAFSTINKSNSDDESHGNILSDDENVNTNVGVAKRMSTPLISQSPNRPAQQLFETPNNNDLEGKNDQQYPTSSSLDVFSPINNPSPTHAFPEEGEIILSPSIAIPATEKFTHPRIANLRNQRKTSTPNHITSVNRMPLSKRIHSVITNVSAAKVSNTPTRRHARSPCSHLSSSVIKIDDSLASILSEKRRKTLDTVKVDLYSVISKPENLLQKYEGDRAQNSARGKKSLPCRDAQVMLTPMRDSFVEKISSSGNRIKLKSLGFVDALSPKRVVTSNGKILTSKEKVLYECDQCEPISFEEALDGVIIESCVKLGEGLYGEVFRCKYINRKESVAIKIIPIEGSLIVNNEKQKTFEEILPEIISSKELHLLSNERENATNGFIELFKVTCVKGKYPDFLIQAWDDYDEDRQSENDRPDKFTDEQLYLIFQYADGGMDVEHFKFKSANQAFSVVQQVCAALAVAEKTLQFEHRDLHWGNILVTNTTEKTISTTIDSKTASIKTHGVKASIIDFTLSRLSKGGVTVFQNLAADPDLFTMDANEDYQFEIYQMMKTATKNNWSIFQPKNNIFWLHYLNKKFCQEIKYLHRKTNVHKSYLSKLKRLDTEILQYNSCLDAIQSSDLLSICQSL